MNAVTDLHLSSLPRKDPVVYGGEVRSDGLLPETLEKYRQDGFVRFDNFLDGAHVAALGKEADRLRGETGDVHKSSILIGSLVSDPALLGPVRQILGGPVYVHCSRIYDAAGPVAAPFHWHSDFETWHAEDGMLRMRAVTAQIFLSDVTPENGPLMLIPGSHLHSSARAVELIERNGIVTATGPAGSMVLFDCNLLHGSNGNITPMPRTTLSIVYNSVDNRPAADRDEADVL